MLLKNVDRQMILKTLFWQSLFCLNAYAEYPIFKELSDQEKLSIDTKNTAGSYLDYYFTSNIRATDVHSILEIGSYDAVDALKLSEYYKCHVFSFECNPESIALSKKNIGDNPNVTQVPFAGWNKTETIPFYPIVETEGICYCPESSSCFRVDRKGHHKTYIQKQILVPAVRLDDWLNKKNISSIDMLCLDVQGAALQVLEGMGNYLKDVKYIITEAEHKGIYLNEALLSEVEKFLDEKGFKMYVGRINRFFGDYLFVRKDIIKAWWGEE